MNASILPRLRVFGAVSILVFAVSAAVAQIGPEGKPEGAASPGGTGSASKPADNAGPGSKKTKAGTTPAKPAAPAGYATEAEARAHCRGTVVWVDNDHFNHYPGSREYGRKPGAFGCERG